MWPKLKEQLPAVVVTVLLVLVALGGYAFYVNAKVIPDMQAAQQREMAAVREQHAAELKASGEETRRQIDAVNTLLKDAIQKRAADAFMTDDEIAKLNAEKVNQLAEAIATKIQPFNPLPKTPEEAERVQNEQVDKVSGRLADKIQPILAQMSRDQNLTRESIASYSQLISDQVGSVLTAELAKNQQLNNNIQTTQAIAQDSLAISHELTALYLSSLKDQGVLTRLLTLPANIIKDASQMSIVSSSDRKKKEEELVRRMNELQQRLQAAQAQAPKK